MKLNADVDVVNNFFDRSNHAKIAQEEIDENLPNVFSRVYCVGWRAAEEYHRGIQKKNLSEEEDAIQRGLRLP